MKKRPVLINNQFDGIKIVPHGRAQDMAEGSEKKQECDAWN